MPYDELKLFYVFFHKTYKHQTWYIDNLGQRFPFGNLYDPWSCGHMMSYYR